MHLYCNINLKIDILPCLIYKKERKRRETIREKEKERNNFLINIEFNNKISNVYIYVYKITNIIFCTSYSFFNLFNFVRFFNLAKLIYKHVM